jgi:hypothetical protein
MAMFVVTGRVIDAASFAPLKKVAVSLTAAASLFANVPGAQEAHPPATSVVVWTRELTDFAGNRWQCWVKHVREQVEGITWSEFCQRVLEINPMLVGDDYIFCKEKTYYLPTNSAQAVSCLRTQSDDDGNYALSGLDQAEDYELSLELPGYNAFRELLYLSQDTERNVRLHAQAGHLVSHYLKYDELPEKAHKVIDQALSMLGDDHVVFDSLPPELQRLCHGAYYLEDPNSIYYKDICCADLVTVCLRAAGLDIEWPADASTGGEHITPHAANYYRPWPGNPKLVELGLVPPWLPGDILIYGNGEYKTNRVQHVNLYVGPFSGTDRSGCVHRYSERYEVVNASIDFMQDGVERGTGVTPLTLKYCIERRCDYDWAKRVRLVELQQEYDAAKPA